MQNRCDRQPAEYAGFWVRLFAYALDSLVVWAGLLIVRLIFLGVNALIEGTFLGGNILFHYTLKDIVLYGFQVLYFILCTYLTGTTLGKRVLNLRVVTTEDDEKLTLLNVVYRETVGRFLCGLSIGIGYLIVGIDREKRGFHDMLCDTRVVYAKRIKVSPIYSAPRMQPMPPYGPGQPMPPHGPMGNPGQPMPPHGPGQSMPPQGPIVGTGQPMPPYGQVSRCRPEAQ